MTTTRTRVLIADDHAVVRTGLRALLAADPAIEVVAEAAAAGAAVERCRIGDVDVVLMDLRFAGDATAGVLATAAIRDLADPPQVLVLTSHDTDADILGAIEAGACGYLLKDAGPDELLGAVRAAADGESALSPTVAARLISRMRDPRPVLLAYHNPVHADVVEARPAFVRTASGRDWALYTVGRDTPRPEPTGRG